MNNQTAVEWLQWCMELHLSHEQKTQFEGLFQHAISINKHQIKGAYLTGLICPIVMDATKQAEEYYLETFKKD